jgi:hypothetical protein
MAKTDILLFVEDPSAANYAALLLPAFIRKGWRTRIYASGVACESLRARGMVFAEAPSDSDARSLLSLINPSCVLTGNAENPETLGLRLIDAAREAGIPSVGFVDALMRAFYRFRGTTADPLAHAPDLLLVPDDRTGEAFAALGYPPENTVVCGHPQYDETMAVGRCWDKEGGPADFRRRLFPGVAVERKILTFVSEGSFRYPSARKSAEAEYGFLGRGADKGRTRIVLEEVLDAVAGFADKPYFVFRAHPIEKAEDYAEYGADVDRFSSGGSPLELVYASDLTVGMTSMLLLEAALLGRPTLAVLARKSEIELLPNVRVGLTPHVLNRRDLRSMLPALLAHDDAKPDSSNVDQLVTGAAERVVSTLEGVIGQKEHLWKS